MTTSQLVLFDYFRSSAAYRVRIALHLKRLSFDQVGVHLLRDGGEHLLHSYRDINAQALVPTFVNRHFSLTQSLAIIEYLDELYPEVPLLPSSREERAKVRQVALTIACDIHPLNNLRVLERLSKKLGLDDTASRDWVRHWIIEGFVALDIELGKLAPAGRFCVGHSPTVADCCLVPQVFNALRFGIELSRFPRLRAIAEHCDSLEAFQKAHPKAQPELPPFASHQFSEALNKLPH